MFFWIPFFRFFRNLILMFDLFLKATYFQSLYFYHSFLIVWFLLTLVFSPFPKLTFSILFSGIDSLLPLCFLLTQKNHIYCLPSNLDSSFPFSFLFILPLFQSSISIVLVRFVSRNDYVLILVLLVLFPDTFDLIRLFLSYHSRIDSFHPLLQNRFP